MPKASERALLYARLQEVLGTEPASILMQHLPSTDDLATKDDVLALRADIGDLGRRMDGLEQRMDGLEHRMDGLEHRMDGLEHRMERLEDRMDRLDGRMERLEDRMDACHGALRDQTRQFILAVTGTMASFAAVVVATGILT